MAALLVVNLFCENQNELTFQRHQVLEMNASVSWDAVVPLFVPADEESASTAIGFIMKGLCK